MRFRFIASYRGSLSRSRLCRLMRESGIQVVRSRKFKRTADSIHAFNIAPNLLQPTFSAAGVNQKRVGDITCICTRKGRPVLL